MFFFVFFAENEQHQIDMLDGVSQAASHPPLALDRMFAPSQFKSRRFGLTSFVSRCGLAVRRLAGQQKDLRWICFGSPFSSKIVNYGHCLVTLPTQLMKH